MAYRLSAASIEVRASSSPTLCSVSLRATSVLNFILSAFLWGTRGGNSTLKPLSLTHETSSVKGLFDL
jgi:hypothetical protein